jgi:hypothetical protein
LKWLAVLQHLQKLLPLLHLQRLRESLYIAKAGLLLDALESKKLLLMGVR